MPASSAAPIAASLEAALLAAGSTGPLAARRAAAVAAFRAAEMPSRSHHLWRYTDPRRLRADGLRVAAPSAAAPSIPPGTFVRDLDEAAALPEVAALLGSLSGESGHVFEALDLALFRGGSFVEFSKGADPAKPLVLARRAGPAGTAAFARTLVVVRAGVEAALLEQVDGDGDPADRLLHGVTEIFLEPGARLLHAQLGRADAGTRVSSVSRARIDAGASLTSVVVVLGGAVSKVESSVVLAGEGASSAVLGTVLGDGRRQSDLHFHQDHAAPRTRSDLLVRAALLDRARSSYTGRLRIDVGAAGSEARQENRNLLLSPEARADSIPELEILNHDVLCSHAASTGPVDPEMLFFLRSRGLDASEAERLVVLGFLEPVFLRAPGASLPDELREAASARLGGRR